MQTANAPSTSTPTARAPSAGATARLGLIAMLLLSVFAWAPATFGGYWQATHGFTPQFNLGQTTVVATIGVAPDLWRGVGSAVNLLTEPWHVLGLDATTAVRLGFVLAFLLGGCGLYAWLRGVLGDRAAGLAGLVYMLQPLFLSTVYVHGSLADALVLAWLPLALAGLAASARRRAVEGAAVAVIAIVALWRTQAGLAVGASLLLLAYAVLVERHWTPVLVTLTASAAALLTLLPFWTLAAPAPVVFGEHFAALNELLAPGSIAGSSAIAGSRPQLGFAVVAYGLLALWGWAVARRRLAGPQRRLLGFALGGSLLLVVLSLDWSAGLWQASGAGRLLTYPWQILLLAAPLLAVAAGSLPLLLPELAAPPYWSALAALVVLASTPYLAPAYTTVQPPAKPVALLGANQLAVLAAQLEESASSTEGGSGEAPRTATLAISWQVLQPLASDDNIFFQAIAGAGEDARVVAQLDAQPLGDASPATSWQPGQILAARYTLDLAQAPEGEPLRYYFGFYDWRSGRRLLVDGGIDDKLVFYGE